MPASLPPSMSVPLALFSSSAVDEEFETVSTQLLKRTQAMLNKYRLLLLEESRVGGRHLLPLGTLPPSEASEGRREAGGQMTGAVCIGPHPPRVHPVALSSPSCCFTCPPSPPQRVSPSAEMVMIDRMFIQEEKTTLALDKQLAKEKPGERGPEGKERCPQLLPSRGIRRGGAESGASPYLLHHQAAPEPPVLWLGLPWPSCSETMRTETVSLHHRVPFHPLHPGMEGTPCHP